MGQHPNGNGQHFHQAPHWPQPPYHYPPPQQMPGGNGFSITKGYVPLVLVCTIVCTIVPVVAIGTWQVASAWTTQQRTIDAVQQDVLGVKQDVKDLRTEVKNSVTEITKALERSPWQGEVRATAKR